MSDNIKIKFVMCREVVGIYYWEDDFGKCKGVCLLFLSIFVFILKLKYIIIFMYLEFNIKNFVVVVNCSFLFGLGIWYDVSLENLSYGFFVIVICNSSLFMVDGKIVKIVICFDMG